PILSLVRFILLQWRACRQNTPSMMVFFFWALDFVFQNVVCGSSLSLNSTRRVMLVETVPCTWLQRLTTGPTYGAMLSALWNVVSFVRKRKGKLLMQVYICHCQYRHNHGQT